MSTADILNELPRLTPDERRQIAARLAELEGVVPSEAAESIPTAVADELRAKLDRFAAEWDSPEMSPYDNYDAARARLPSR